MQANYQGDSVQIDLFFYFQKLIVTGNQPSPKNRNIINLGQFPTFQNKDGNESQAEGNDKINIKRQGEQKYGRMRTCFNGADQFEAIEMDTVHPYLID